METILPFLVILGSLTVIGVAVLLSIRQTQRLRAEKAELARSLGLHPLDSPPPDLVDRIKRLQWNLAGRKLELRAVSTQSTFERTTYLFDVYAVGKNTQSVSSDTVAVVDGSLRLPRFSILPRVTAGGVVGRLANALVDRFMGRENARIDLPAEPGATTTYVLVGPSGEEIKRLVTPGLTRFLSGKANLAVQGEGDCFTVARFTRGRTSSRSEPTALQYLLSDAGELHRILRG